LEFAQIAADRGCDLAARQVYGLDDMADLEYRWLAHLHHEAKSSAPVAHAQSTASSPPKSPSIAFDFLMTY
jgi:hypothetical protein